jgi:hypothetical protein
MIVSLSEGLRQMAGSQFGGDEIRRRFSRKDFPFLSLDSGGATTHCVNHQVGFQQHHLSGVQHPSPSYTSLAELPLVARMWMNSLGSIFNLTCANVISVTLVVNQVHLQRNSHFKLEIIEIWGTHGSTCEGYCVPESANVSEQHAASVLRLEETTRFHIPEFYYLAGWCRIFMIFLSSFRQIPR